MMIKKNPLMPRNKRMIVMLFSLLLVLSTGYSSNLQAEAPGKILWQYEFTRLDEGYMSKVTPVGDRLLVPMGMEDMVCLNVATGRVMWQNLSSNPNRNTHKPAVAVWQGKFFTPDNFDFEKGVMQCFDVATGKKVWSYQTPQGAHSGVKYRRRQIDTTPVVANGRLYFHDFQGIIYCLNAQSGALIWKTDINAVKNLQPTTEWSAALNQNFTTTPDAVEFFGPIYVEGNYVFASSTDGSVLCLNATNGSKVWLNTLPESSQTDFDILAAWGGRFYLCYHPWRDGSAVATAHTLTCYDVATGKALWQSPRLVGTQSHSVQLNQGLVEITGVNALFGSPNNLSHLTWLNAQNGVLMNRRDVPYAIQSDSVLSGDKRYYLRWDFNGDNTFNIVLYCEHPVSGALLWKTPLVINSGDWYNEGTVPKTRYTAITIENGRAFIVINKQLWCVQVGPQAQG